MMQEGRDWDRLVINRKDTTGEERVIGHTQIRKGGIAKVTGTAQYGSDVDLPGQLYAAVARSPYPHARILQINTQEAAALSGVRAVITGADCPTLFGSFIADQPIVAREKVRYQGEPVAAVAADTQEIAREAARLIQVEYEQLPVVNDLETSMKNEVLVHEDWSQYDCSSACFPVQGTNIGDQYHLKKGDVEAGFAQADEIVESDFTCGMLQHTTIETHTATAQADPISGEIHIWVPAQSPFSNRGLIAKTFHVPMEKVRLTVTEIGGGFGGKYEAKCEPIAVALSLKAKGRPVKLTYGRDEEFAATVCRSPVHIHMKTGVKRDGTLTAQKVDIQWDAGAYVTTNPRVDYNAGFAANGPYKIPNAQVDAYVYMTNKTLGTAYRGFGVTEVATAHERQMDRIAEKLGIDPLELRLKNVLQNGDVGITGEIMHFRGIGHGKRLDVGATDDCHVISFRRRLEEQAVVYRIRIRLLDGSKNGHIVHDFVSCRKDPFDGRRSRRFRAYKIKGCVRCGTAAFEVAVGRTNRNPLGIGGAANAAAGTAGKLQDTGAGIQEVSDHAVFHEFEVNLAGADAADKAHAFCHLVSLKNSRGFFEVAVRTIGAAANKDLVDGHFRCLFNGYDVIGQMRQGNERLQGRQVNIDFLIIRAAFIRQDFFKVPFPSLGPQIVTDHVISWEKGRRGIHFSAHIGDGHAFRYGKGFCPVTYIFEELSRAALDGNAAQHFKDDILCRYSGTQMARQVHLDNLRHLQDIRKAGKSGGNIHPTYTDGKHAHGTAAWRMAVAAQKKQARFGKTAAVQGVADAIARFGKDKAVFFSKGLEINMVVRRLVIDLQQVMVNVAYG